VEDKEEEREARKEATERGGVWLADSAERAEGETICVSAAVGCVSAAAVQGLKASIIATGRETERERSRRTRDQLSLARREKESPQRERDGRRDARRQRGRRSSSSTSGSNDVTAAAEQRERSERSEE
jgi:hypothetical protein